MHPLPQPWLCHCSQEVVLEVSGQRPKVETTAGQYVCVHACRNGKASSNTLLHAVLAACRPQLSHGYLPGSGLPAELVCPGRHARCQINSNNSMIWKVLSQHDQLRPCSHHAKRSLTAKLAGLVSDVKSMLPGKITWPACRHNDAAYRQSVLLECCQRMLCPWLKPGDQMPERKEHCAEALTHRSGR